MRAALVQVSTAKHIRNSKEGSEDSYVHIKEGRPYELITTFIVFSSISFSFESELLSCPFLCITRQINSTRSRDALSSLQFSSIQFVYSSISFHFTDRHEQWLRPCDQLSPRFWQQLWPSPALEWLWHMRAMNTPQLQPPWECRQHLDFCQQPW